MTSRVIAPTLTPGVKLQGPVSYFPSIEKTYGRPMQEWIDLVVERFDAGDTHMAIVNVLKAENGVGHGHANAIVAYVKKELA